MLRQKATELVRYLYNETVRLHLPRKIAVYNGVGVRAVRLFDATDVVPDYEEPLIRGLRAQIRADDTVVVVGAGWGVSTAVSARHADRVIAYEAGNEQLRQARETLEINKLSDDAEIRHGIVGTDVEVYGETTAPHVDPGELPKCDILELDCEGAELEILDNLDQRPRVLIVEAHAIYGAPAEEVEARLETFGYEVVDRGVESEEHGAVVMTSVLEES